VEIGGLRSGRIEDGRLIEAREQDDVMGVMQQFGMEIKPTSPTKWRIKAPAVYTNGRGHSIGDA
jgi:hypothetical protein